MGHTTPSQTQQPPQCFFFLILCLSFSICKWEKDKICRGCSSRLSELPGCLPPLDCGLTCLSLLRPFWSQALDAVHLLNQAVHCVEKEVGAAAHPAPPDPEVKSWTSAVCSSPHGSHSTASGGPPFPRTPCHLVTALPAPPPKKKHSRG